MDGIVVPVFEAHFVDFKVERSDKIASPGMINSQVINRLFDADLVIVDMSAHNANAFYEMAIRHMVRRPVIHMYRKGESIPFDVAPHRAIPFSYDEPRNVKEAQNDLKSAVDDVLKPGFVVENPITHARGRFELEQHATPEMKVLADEMAALRSRVVGLERYTEVIANAASRAIGSPPTDADNNRLLAAVLGTGSLKPTGLFALGGLAGTAPTSTSSKTSRGILGDVFVDLAKEAEVTKNTKRRDE